MAPTKRKTSGEPNSTRVTRSSTRKTQTNAAVAVVEPSPKPKKAKITAKEKPEPKAKGKAKETPKKQVENGNGSKTVVIEHCTQCRQFKIRAFKVKDDLESAVSGINVLLNPEKPRRGCFEVREESGKKFISLLDMKRPFAPMKALDMDAVVADIIDQIK